MIINAKELVKKYGDGESEVIALNSINFSAQSDEFIAIMGRSGCGKTTLINILATLDFPDTGEYYLDDTLVSKLSEKQLAQIKRRKVAVIFQNYNLVEEITVHENLILPFVFDKRNYDKNYFDEIVTDLGLKEKLNKYPAQLSGGEKQRVSIARALMIKPVVILADEPTGNLDYSNAINVVKMLKTCSQKYKQTVVMVTHDRELADFADRIVFMQDGQIINEVRCQ
ncbi:MAG TPA: ABC transporter ATP-binding protein [Mobilitalea sp.]|nr:ABC transporter ATP-binding protein [Mobilitalea sp.]